MYNNMKKLPGEGNWYNGVAKLLETYKITVRGGPRPKKMSRPPLPQDPKIRETASILFMVYLNVL